MKPGRKSSAQLSVIKNNIDQRPEPPDELTPEQAELWNTVVATKPADWFSADTHKLLVSFCKHATTAKMLDEQIDNFKSEWLSEPEGVTRFEKLTNMREKQSRSLTALARSMRITQQTHYRPDKAIPKPVQNKPWQK